MSGKCYWGIFERVKQHIDTTESILFLSKQFDCSERVFCSIRGVSDLENETKCLFKYRIDAAGSNGHIILPEYVAEAGMHTIEVGEQKKPFEVDTV